MCLGVPSGLFSHANNSNTGKHSLCDASSCPSSLGEVGDVSMLQTCPQHVVSWLTGHLILADGQKGNSALVPPLELWLFSLTFLPETVVLVKWATKTSKPWSSRNSFQSPYLEECVWKGMLNNFLWCLCRIY